MAGPVHRLLGGVPNVKLIDPLSYEAFVYLMDRSFCVVTDSGGIQEEASSLGKPVLVTGNSTERQEGIDAGTAILVGTDAETIESELELLLHDGARYASFEAAEDPYGDGQATRRIIEVLAAFVGIETRACALERPTPTAGATRKSRRPS